MPEARDDFLNVGILTFASIAGVNWLLVSPGLQCFVGVLISLIDCGRFSGLTSREDVMWSV